MAFTRWRKKSFERGINRPVDGELHYGGDVPVQAAARGQAFVSTQPNAAVSKTLDDLARTLAGAVARVLAAGSASAGAAIRWTFGAVADSRDSASAGPRPTGLVSRGRAAWPSSTRSGRRPRHGLARQVC